MIQKLRQDESIGDNLRKLRNKSENGELNIKVTVLRKLQEYYNCGYEEFFKPIKKNKR